VTPKDPFSVTELSGNFGVLILEVRILCCIINVCYFFKPYAM
jgi:hypothetical protein